MIKPEWRGKPELYLKALLLRLHGREANITPDELERADRHVLTAVYIGDKVQCRARTAQSWPESEARIDAIGQNGNDGDHYKEFDGFI